MTTRRKKCLHVVFQSTTNQRVSVSVLGGVEVISHGPRVLSEEKDGRFPTGDVLAYHRLTKKASICRTPSFKYKPMLLKLVW